MHQQRFARLETAALEHIVPDGEDRLRQRRRLDHRETGGDGEGGAGRRDGEARIAAARHEGRHRIADSVTADACSQRRDRAGDLKAGKVGGAGRRRVAAAPLEDVGPVHAGCGDADQHLAGSGPRHRPLDGRQHLRPARLPDRNGGHGFGQRIHAGHPLVRRLDGAAAAP